MVHFCFDVIVEDTTNYKGNKIFKIFSAKACAQASQYCGEKER